MTGGVRNRPPPRAPLNLDASECGDSHTLALSGRKRYPLRWKKYLGPKGSCVSTNLSIHTLPFFCSSLQLCRYLPQLSALPLSCATPLSLEFPQSGHGHSPFPPLTLGSLKDPPSVSTKGAQTLQGAGRGNSYGSISVMKRLLGEENGEGG